MMTENILLELQSILDHDSIKTDSSSLQTYGRDWTTLFQPNPLAIVFPKSIEQIQELIIWAKKNCQALVPSGGRTGLSGGAVTTNGEIVVSLEKMNQILDFNPVERTVTCQAGVVTENLQTFAKEKNLFYPVSLASQGSCQIGGNIATNAGGLHVIRYGETRAWVKGLKVVTGNGDILDLNHGLVKNATGYDLRQLFIGSEGTLGIIVEAMMGLTSLPLPTQVMVLGIKKLSDALKILAELYKKSLAIIAFEFFSLNALQHVIEHIKAQPPFVKQTTFYLLIEFESPNEETFNNALNVFEEGVAAGWISDGIISQNESQKQNLWKLRENITVAIAPFMPFKDDIAVNVSVLPEFIIDLEKIAAASQLQLVLFGHIGDGNIHVNILKPKELSEAEFLAECLSLNKRIFALVERMRGSVSAEHGIGLLKKDYLKFTRNAEEIRLMQGIKRLFDPNGIMNPGKIFNL